MSTNTKDGRRPIKEYTGGARNTRPIPGTGQTASNRNIVPDAAYAEATNSATWTASENVTEIYLTLFPDADLGGVPLEHAWVVFDALDATQAQLLLAQGGASGDAAVDVQKYPLPFGVRTGPFIGTSYFSRLDLDMLTANGVLFVEAQ